MRVTAFRTDRALAPIVLISVLALGAARPGQAAVISLSAVDFGSAESQFEPEVAPGSFVAFYDASLVAGNGTGQVMYRSILEFDLTAVLGETVTSAYLELTTASATANPGYPLRQFGYAGDGTASLADADVTGDTALPNIVSSGGGGTFHSTDVTTFIAALVGNPSTYAGFVVAESTVLEDFGFETFVAPGSPLDAPRLAITYDDQEEEGPPETPVPEPASLLLLGTGLVAALGRRLRRPLP